MPADDIFYPVEKLTKAAIVLAAHPERVKVRLVEAWHHLQTLDKRGAWAHGKLPEPYASDLQEVCENLSGRLARRRKGQRPPRPRDHILNMRIAKAERIARAIIQIALAVRSLRGSS